MVSLVKFIWERRAKSYVRVSLALIAGGVAVFTVSPLIMVLEMLGMVLVPPDRGAPWWIAPLFGALLVGLGVVIYAVCYATDRDRGRPPPPSPSLTMAVPANWTFEEVAIAIGQKVKRSVVLDGFTKAEKAVTLRQQQISADAVEDLLGAARTLAIGGGVPEFDVRSDGGVITVRRK